MEAERRTEMKKGKEGEKRGVHVISHLGEIVNLECLT